MSTKNDKEENRELPEKLNFLQESLNPTENLIEKVTNPDQSGENLKLVIKKKSIQEEVDLKKDKDDLENAPYTFRLYWVNFLPNLTAVLVNSFCTIIEYSFISRLKGEKFLAGITLGETYVCIVYYYFASGFMDGMCIECSKSFGRGRLRRLGIQMNQYRFFLYIFSILDFLINFIFCGKILRAIQGSNTDFVDISIKYIPFGFLYYFLTVNYEIYCKYAETQLVFRPVLYSVFVAFGTQVLCLYVFLQVLEYEFYGIVLSQVITEFCKILFMVGYFIIVRPYPESHFFMFFDRRMIRNLWNNTKLSLLSACIFLFEYAGESVLGIIASTIGTDVYAKYIIISAIGLVPYIFCYAILSTTCIIVGVFVGKDDPVTIKKVIFHSLIFGHVVIFIILGIMAIFPKPFLEFFGESDEAIDVYLSPMYWMLASYYFDYLQNNLQGILRGFGYIRIATCCSLFFNLIVQGVLSYILGHKWEVSGLYIAVLIMFCGLGISYFVILMTVNIKDSCKEIKEEEERMKEQNKSGTQGTLIASFNSKFNKSKIRHSLV